MLLLIRAMFSPALLFTRGVLSNLDFIFNASLSFIYQSSCLT
jgi:hypothetical protein